MDRLAVAALKTRANTGARDVLPIIEDIRASGITGLNGIAAELNRRGILTARGARWWPTTVRNLLARAQSQIERELVHAWATRMCLG
jgi:Recombinase